MTMQVLIKLAMSLEPDTLHSSMGKASTVCTWWRITKLDRPRFKSITYTPQDLG